MRRSIPLTLLACFTLMVGCQQTPERYLAKGNELYKVAKYDEAILNYKKAIQKNDRFGEAYYRLALVQLKTGDNREAYVSLSSARALLPGRADVRVTLADLLLLAYMGNKSRPAGIYQQLTSISDELLTGDPNSYNGLRIKANLAWSDGQFQPAEELFQRANQAKPKQPDLVLSWMQVLFKDGQEREGERLGKELLQNRPDAASIYDLLFQHYRSENRLAEAEDILRTKVKNNPNELNYALQLAAFYAARNEREQMSAVLQKLLENPQRYPEAHLRVGDFYGVLHEWPEALRQYEEGARLNPKEKTTYLKRIADSWLAQGQGEKAAGVIGAILKESPKDDAAKAVNASILLKTGNPDKIDSGIQDLQDVLKKDPANPLLRFTLGRAFVAKGDLDSARTEFQESVKRRPDYIPSILAMAEISQLKGDHNLSLRYANQALSVNPRLGRARLIRVTSFMGLHDYAQARTELTTLAKDFPQDVEVRFQTAHLDLIEKRYQEGESTLEKLYEKDRVRALAGLSDLYVAEGRPEKALSRLTIEVAKPPDSVALRLLLADTAKRCGKYDVALEQYQHLEAMGIKSAQLDIRLGQVYQLKGDVEKALTSFQAAKDLAPRDPAATGALADAFRLTGRNAEAMVNYRRLLQLQPDNGSAMNNVAFLLLENGGTVDEAQRLAERALQISPQDPNFADTLGMIYLKKNLEDSALQVFSGLVRRFPDNPEYRFHYGLTLTNKGETAKAKSELLLALRKTPPEDLRKNIQTTLAKIQ